MIPTPPLNAESFARAFPFYLHLDTDLCVLSAGKSLRKTCPDLQVGAPLQASFTIRRPRGISSIAVWRRHAGEACTLVSLSHTSLTLRGSVEVYNDGLLLLISPVLTSLDDVTRLGLQFSDFAKHDASRDSLWLIRTSIALQEDAFRMADRLRSRTEQLTTILEMSQSGVIYFDCKRRLQHVNTALLNMLGLQRSTAYDLTIEALDAWISDLLAVSEPCRLPFAAMLNDQVAQCAGMMLQLARPKSAVLNLTSAPNNDAGFVFFLRDVTHETAVDRMKSEFIEAAAHELRTPMVSVYGFTELLLSRAYSDVQRQDMLQTIHRQSKLLINMVNEMLDLSRIEARRGKDLEREPCRLNALINEAVKPFARPGFTPRVQVNMRHADAVVHVDAGKTLRALTNVLSNACKYSINDSPVTVDSLDGTLQDSPAIGLRVTDHGIGMTPEQQARIFERFYRADPSGNIPGTGLGMSLVKETVELHGGRIEITSKAGTGTAVTLWWPLGTGPFTALACRAN